MALTNEQLDALRRFAGVSADADGETLLAGFSEAVDEYREHYGDEEFRRRIDASLARHREGSSSSTHPATSRPVAGHLGPDARCDSHDIDDVLAWAVGTGRLAPGARAEFWRGEAAAEQTRTGSTLATEAAIRNLRPLWYESDRPTNAAGDVGQADETPLLSALDAAIFGPSQADRERAQDLAAEAELRAQIDAEQAERATSAQRAELARQQQAAQDSYAVRLAELDRDPAAEAIERGIYPQED